MKRFFLALVLVGTFLPLSRTEAAPIIGTKKVAVILFNFRNDLSQPDTVEPVRQKTFTNANSVAALYRKASFGRLNLVGDVFGWYTINADHPGFDTCPTQDTIGDWRAKALARAGINPSDGLYHYFIFLHPAIGSCGEIDEDSPETGGVVYSQYPTSAFINGEYDVHVVAHEFGHMLGWGHAEGLFCGQGELSTNSPPMSFGACAKIPYADHYSVMGGMDQYQESPLPDGSKLYATGWLDDNQVLTIYRFSGSNIYSSNVFDLTINPLYSTASGHKLIKIPLGNYVHALFVEYRPALYPFDNFLAKRGSGNGVLVRLAPVEQIPIFFRESNLIDANPGNPAVTPGTLMGLNFVNSVLSVGARPVIHDPTGVMVRTMLVTPTNAKVRVEFPGVELDPIPNSANLVGTVPITFITTGGAATVRLTQDGSWMKVWNYDPNSPSYTLNWNTVPWPNGEHVIKAEMLDSEAKVLASDEVRVTYNNLKSLNITFPDDGSGVNGLVNVTGVSDGSIAGGELWIGGERKNAVNLSPAGTALSLPWDTRAFPNGPRNIQLVAFGPTGQRIVSPPRTVLINNPQTNKPPSTTQPGGSDDSFGPALSVSGSPSPWSPSDSPDQSITITATANDPDGIASINVKVGNVAEQSCSAVLSSSRCNVVTKARNLPVGQTVTVTAIDRSSANRLTTHSFPIISSAGGTGVSDRPISSGSTLPTSPTLFVRLPRGGEVWKIGETKEINWSETNYQYSPGLYKIYASTRDGSWYGLINQTGERSLNWQVGKVTVNGVTKTLSPGNYWIQVVKQDGQTLPNGQAKTQAFSAGSVELVKGASSLSQFDWLAGVWGAFTALFRPQ